MIRTLVRALAAACVVIAASSAAAQSPIQWNGNAQTAIARAQEQLMPLMFWVTERADLFEDDDLRDAQERSFRDPTVVAIAQKQFIPVRVARNSRVQEEAAKFGLPTAFGLYIALISPDGVLLDQIDATQVAEPEALAARLAAGAHKYRQLLYTKQIKPVLESPESPKMDVRRACQIVWRLGMVEADQDLVGLLKRPDITPTERARLYDMLAAIATKPCIEALLDRAAAGDKDAAASLGRAEAGALEYLLPELPDPAGEGATDRQLVAYRAASRIIADQSSKPDAFWKTAKPEQRRQAIERLKNRAQPVLDYWKQTAGSWR